MSLPSTNERLAGIAATITIAGLFLVGRGASEAGAWVTLAGLASLMFAIHRYGRLGEEGADSEGPNR